MRKLYLHIGTEKTGTTSIQHTLFVNRAVLKEAGFHFLQCAGKKNHRAISASCIADKRSDEFLQSQGVNTIEQRREFRQELLQSLTLEMESLPPSVHSVIISSEFFHSRNNALEEAENVYNFLSPFFSEIKVICYLREQSKVVTSHYSTALKSGVPTDFNAWVDSVCQPEKPYYNYYSLLKNWAAVFGKDNLCLRFFDRKTFVNNDLLDDFFTQIDQKLLSCIVKEGIKNESITMLGQFLACASNKVFAQNVDQKTGLKDLRQEMASLIAGEFNGSGQCVTAEKYDEIYKAFHESNVLVNKEFFNAQDGSNCFAYDPPKNNTNIIELNGELSQKIANVALGINKMLMNNYAGKKREFLIATHNTQVESASINVFIKSAICLPAVCMPLIRKHIKKLMRKKDYAKCEKTLNYLVQKAPQTAWAYHLLAQVNCYTDRYWMGLQNINKAVELAPHNTSFVQYRTKLRKCLHSKK